MRNVDLYITFLVPPIIFWRHHLFLWYFQRYFACRQSFSWSTLNPGPAEPGNIQATLTNLLCIARKYLSALADLLMSIWLSWSIGSSTEPLHDPIKAATFWRRPRPSFWHLEVTPQNSSCAPKSLMVSFVLGINNIAVGRVGQGLTLMLLVANLANTKWCKKT